MAPPARRQVEEKEEEPPPLPPAAASSEQQTTEEKHPSYKKKFLKRLSKEHWSDAAPAAIADEGSLIEAIGHAACVVDHLLRLPALFVSISSL